MGKCIDNLNSLIFKILLYKKNHPSLHKIGVYSLSVTKFLATAIKYRDTSIIVDLSNSDEDGMECDDWIGHPFSNKVSQSSVGQTILS